MNIIVFRLFDKFAADKILGRLFFKKPSLNILNINRYMYIGIVAAWLKKTSARMKKKQMYFYPLQVKVLQF